MRVALAQQNPTVGDLAGNAAALAAAYQAAVAQGAELVLGGELGLTGYPPEDLVLKPAFVAATRRALDELARRTGPAPLIVGFVEDAAGEDTTAPATVTSESETVRTLANSAAVLRDGAVEAVYRKHRIPNYGVFDEARYFRAGTEPLVVEVGSERVGVTLCEDLWGAGGPLAAACAAGATVLASLNASPYERGKRDKRLQWAAQHARSGGAWLLYCNLVGGQDEVVFDGDSFVMAPSGAVTAVAARFAEDILFTEVGTGAPAQATVLPAADHVAEAYDALVLGVADYLGKNGFTGALVGVSGGIDSALTAAIAADALGPAALTCVALPSPWSSTGSLTDAEALATALGARYEVIPIAPMMSTFDEALAGLFAGTAPGLAEENLQSRIRGTVLMALSNKWGDLLLATGNKSEYAVGYATLYGDMAGGLAVLKDVDKTLVYALSRYRNTAYAPHWRGPSAPVIPAASLDKPPSAELRPDQLDTDSLPPYDVLDPLLAAYVEEQRAVEELIADGHEPELVRRVARLVDRAEFKRSQAAPGIKVTPRAFGRDRRLPITQRWSG